MREVGVLEAKTNLSALLSEVERGAGDITITRHGKPIARLVAQPTSERSPKQVRRLSGEELEARFRRLRDLISETSPEMNNLTWEDIRDLRDS